MLDPDGGNLLQGANLRCFVDEVRREFFARSVQGAAGETQADSVHIVTTEVYDRLSIDAQAAIVVDLMQANRQSLLDRGPQEIFVRADTAQAHITDLICEVVYQELMNDPIVVMENEMREKLRE